MFDVGEYSSVLIFFSLAAVLSSLFAVLPIFLAKRRDSMEKLVPYECGFDQKEEVSSVFDIKFCIIGILFVIFDVEVTFLFPWSVCLGSIGFAGYFSMLCFLGMLTIGFIYEWNSGALEWE
ncbi:NADH-quinone oxidoreductase subunit A [Anaplasma phagocytophilum]|uniref:NADH-quinone oxidoreductase subunit A n=5 Tax=Anaplasma phagocytophilum TaxID=948 RepID=A0A098EI91_ANAPH|nr:NADH-quinone oxidoreductase subunit A [Anaplasma phagocytophilum]KKA00919.1 NADH-ubiquinone/plastoquinone oxidoreductase, chain 3 family protein [Anaplasma phagocytophilum str. CR1007]ABD43743.1 NADH dehydrogenase I, A subunit [Anaplasma phagocytophilum str. HZ]AGR78826.1 NADH:ubiquinone oxidoreductase subunit A [Anaplasma phagocytophilum str. HZ2]AGR80073.1 NADH:ubiquinone oxidoreductase subunit A [Anaplasma phagocytophilum str. JM]AGR81328.1 NADH:ubiquinone oxidoreductase subunit A [Anapl